MRRSQSIEGGIKAFLTKDYERCKAEVMQVLFSYLLRDRSALLTYFQNTNLREDAEAVITGMRRLWFPLLQLLLMSIRRIGSAEELDALVDAALKARAESPWERLLIQLALGKTDLETALREAIDDEGRSQAYFYSAWEPDIFHELT